DHHRTRLQPAVALGRRDHGHADPVLDRPQGVEVLQLAHDGGLRVPHHPAQPNQRRLAHALGDVVVNLAAEGCRVRHARYPCPWMGETMRPGALSGNVHHVYRITHTNTTKQQMPSLRKTLDTRPASPSD